MDRRRVVITGIGAITPVGLTAEESWKSICRGDCGIGPITRYDTQGQKVLLAAEVKGFEAEQWMEKKEARRMALFSQYALAASVQAMTDSGLEMEKEDAGQCGVILSSGIGGLSVIAEQEHQGSEKGYDRVSPVFIPMSICNMAAGLVAIRHGFRGLCTCPVTACSGGTNAVGDAFHYIRDGYATVMLCGGTEACIHPLAVGGFTSMKALYTGDMPERASIPFDRERKGFVMGEGAGILVLEEYEHALARGARIYAEVAGYGASCDAYHMTAPRSDGSGGAMAMERAIRDAGAVPKQVDYINAHGTSTLLNDKGETLAVKMTFGEHAYHLAISSTKSMTGHMLGAAGAVEAIFTALTLRDQFIPPTIHYKEADPDCDLDVVPNVGRSASVYYALSNSLGFGGHNASILLKRWEEN